MAVARCWKSAKRNTNLTKAGRDALSGRQTNVRLNGINRWLGGVYLKGEEVLWRWEERAQRLVRR